MSAEHYQFILLVAAGDLGDCVVGFEVLIVKLRSDVQFHLDRQALRQNSRDPVIMLDSQDDGGKDWLRIFFARSAALHKDRSAIARAADLEYRRGPFFF